MMNQQSNAFLGVSPSYFPGQPVVNNSATQSRTPYGMPISWYGNSYPTPTQSNASTAYQPGQLYSFAQGNKNTANNPLPGQAAINTNAAPAPQAPKQPAAPRTPIVDTRPAKAAPAPVQPAAAPASNPTINTNSYLQQLGSLFNQNPNNPSLSAALPTSNATLPNSTNMALPDSLQSLKDLSDIQRRSAIATDALYGGGMGTDTQSQNYYLDLLEKDLPSGSGGINFDQLLPIERNYLQSIGLPVSNGQDFLNALAQRYTGV